jgi:hypothetical protein
VSNYVKVNYLKKKLCEGKLPWKKPRKEPFLCPTLNATAKVLHAQATVVPLLSIMAMGTHDPGIRRVKT